MKKKLELLKECAGLLEQPNVANWYEQNLEKKSQYETINSLENGVSSSKLTIREALSIALLVGFQWYVKFEGVP